MGKKSKNISSRQIFTHTERKEAKKYHNTGKQTRTISLDTIVTPDTCFLCLKLANDPLICNKGHLYCKSCIIENLLDQKRKQKKLDNSIIQYQNKKKEEQENIDLQIYNEKCKKFLDQQNSYTMVQSPIVKNIPRGYKETNTIDNKIIYTLDTDLYNKQIEARNSSIDKDHPIQSFWVPEITPKHKNISIPSKITTKSYTICPSSQDKHHVRFHIFRSVNFMPHNFTDITSSQSNSKCPFCDRIFSKHISVSVLRVCGHAFCNSCIDSKSQNNLQDLVKFENDNDTNSKALTESTTTVVSTNEDKKNSSLESTHFSITCPYCDTYCPGAEIVTIQTGLQNLSSKTGNVIQKTSTPFLNAV